MHGDHRRGRAREPRQRAPRVLGCVALVLRGLAIDGAAFRRPPQPSVAAELEARPHGRRKVERRAGSERRDPLVDSAGPWSVRVATRMIAHHGGARSAAPRRAGGARMPIRRATPRTPGRAESVRHHELHQGGRQGKREREKFVAQGGVFYERFSQSRAELDMPHGAASAPQVLSLHAGGAAVGMYIDAESPHPWQGVELAQRTLERGRGARRRCAGARVTQDDIGPRAAVREPMDGDHQRARVRVHQAAVHLVEHTGLRVRSIGRALCSERWVRVDKQRPRVELKEEREAEGQGVAIEMSVRDLDQQRAAGTPTDQIGPFSAGPGRAHPDQPSSEIGRDERGGRGRWRGPGEACVLTNGPPQRRRRGRKRGLAPLVDRRRDVLCRRLAGRPVGAPARRQHEA